MLFKSKVYRTILFGLSVYFCLLYFLVVLAWAVPFISKETELNLGREADKEVVQQFGIYQDKALQLYINDIGQNLVAKLTNKEFSRFHFKLVDSSVINAFALPGGYVYITRGLLSALNSEAELASVIGHEVAHVTLHHGAKLMVRSIGAQLLSVGGALASKSPGEWMAVSSAIFQQINSGYGREAELDSDAQGMMNAADAGYQPTGMAGFLRNLRRQEIMSGQAYHSFQASHPETKERIIKADLMASALSHRYSRLQSKQDNFLLHLQGLVYGGRQDSKDKRRYKPQYLEIYTVEEGDTLENIAIKKLGDKRYALDIAVLNGRKESVAIKPGELLKLVRNGVYEGTQAVNAAHKLPDS
jgi:predicted Zn-dependent protease